MLEISVIGLGLVLMLADLFVPAERRRFIGYAAIAALGVLLVTSLSGNGSCGQFGTAFGGMFVNDALSLFFKQLFIVAAILVLFMAAEFSDKLAEGSVAEYYSLILFALAGMLFAASSNDFTMLFVSIELITITFYVLVSFQRSKLQSLEAGVKYLILGALSSAFMVFGIALIWGTTGELNFTKLAAVAPQFADSQIFLLGVLLVLVGLGFKIAAFPFQIWAPDVYQGAPTPTTAFLAIGSKAAGFVLLLRVLFTAVPSVTAHWANLLIVISGITILYGNLCAIPQRNLKRLLGYSSIAHAGYLLLGVAALSASGQSALMYYLAGYVFTVMAAFFVITLVMRHLQFRGNFRPGRLEPAFAAARRHADHRDGFARRHSAAGGILWKISAAQIRDGCGAGHGQSRLLLPALHGAGGRDHLDLLLFWRRPRDLLEQRSGGLVADRALVAGQALHLGVHRRHLLDWFVSKHSFERHQPRGGGVGEIDLIAK